ncbi:unnamed protein product [Toxocara canis]|uniref:Uncharacterized protein n=1 Tax=Toxocara canis TaxID=6265 RepID=A0A3P7H9G9_TOXCA|nr:unnamed protein product [Toxocara canis]
MRLADTLSICPRRALYTLLVELLGMAGMIEPEGAQMKQATRLYEPEEAQMKQATQDKKSEHTEKDSPPIKPAEELRPKKIARNAKEERIAKGKEIRGKGDYPTMDDVLSDWDSEKDGKKQLMANYLPSVFEDKTKQSEEQGEASKAVTNLEEPDENKPASKGDDAPTKPDGPQSEEKDKSAKGSKKEEKSNKSKEESKQKSNRNEEKKEGQDGTKKDEEKKDAQKDSRQGKCQKDEEKKEKSTSKNSVNKENVALHPGVENECEKKPENDKQKASKPSAQEGPNDEKSWPQKTDVTEVETYVSV